MPFLAKRLTAALVIVLGMLCAGCGGAELDDMSYALTVGIDKSDEPDKYIFSYRLAMPRVFVGDGGGGDKEKTKIVSVKSVSLSESARELTMAASRRIELGHVSALFIHEDVAKQGLEPLLSAVLHSQAYRNNMLLLVTRQEAKTVLEKNSAPFELFQYRWVDSIERAGAFVAGYNLRDIREFYRSMRAPEQAALAGLGAVSGDTLERFAAPPLAGQAAPQYQPGTLPRSGGTELVAVGSAVFRGWKMVGSLNSSEALGARLLSEGVDTVLTIDDPLQRGLLLGVSVRSEQPDIDIKLKDGRLRINIEVPVECQLAEQTSAFNYQHQQHRRTLERQLAEALRGNLYAYFAATKPLGADCTQLAEHYRQKCSSYDEWAALDWPELYKNAEVSVAVDVRLQRVGLLERSAEGGESI